MAKVTMLNMAGAEAGTIELKDEIFGIEPNAERCSRSCCKLSGKPETGALSQQRREAKSEEAEESLLDRRN